MSRKRKKSRDYCLTGVIEVCNITRGRRNISLLDLDKPVNIEILEISGSNVEKSPIYGTDDENPLQKEEILATGSSL